MNIADQIADILAENPTGLKASEIAAQIGCTRKNVNSYLYAHTDMYEQHDGYIWTAKSAKRKAPPISRTEQTIAHASYSVNVQQSVGNAVASTLTITPNGTGYLINSTNNQIICCDCNRFFSIHASACPFCGCPLHYIADKYFKSYGAEVIRKAQYQWEEQQKADELKRQHAEQKRKHDVAWECYLNDNNKYRSWKLFEKLCTLKTDMFDRAIERTKFLNTHSNKYTYMTDEQWYQLIVSDDLLYKSSLQKLAQDKQEELKRQEIKKQEELRLQRIKEEEEKAARKKNALEAADVCKRNHVSEHIKALLSGGQYTADEVQSRIDAARYFTRTYPHLNLNEEQFMLLPVEEIKKRVNVMIKSFSKF